MCAKKSLQSYNKAGVSQNKNEIKPGFWARNQQKCTNFGLIYEQKTGGTSENCK